MQDGASAVQTEQYHTHVINFEIRPFKGILAHPLTPEVLFEMVSVEKIKKNLKSDHRYLLYSVLKKYLFFKIYTFKIYVLVNGISVQNWYC